MSDRVRVCLKELEQRKTEYGNGASQRKLELLQFMDKRRLRRAQDVLRLHEVLCFLRAYPDDEDVLSETERMLRSFSERSDLRRFHRDLANTGIAGTSIQATIFACTARWIAQRWPDQLTLDWGELDQPEKLQWLLPYLALYGETPALDEFGFGMREWIERMKKPDETDAAFLLRRLDQLPIPVAMRESMIDDWTLWYELAPGPGTPARTHEKSIGASVAFQTTPLQRRRPVIAEQMAMPARPVRQLKSREGQQLVDLARWAMITRQRDLDAFAYGDCNDVRIVECSKGLQFVYIGVVPERRLLLEAMYGFLMLKNGVPVGYGVFSGLFGSAEIAFTVFDTFRSGEAAAMFVDALATSRQLFGFDTFTLAPYQLGQDNDDAIRSGAWWFYQKLGFRPRDRELIQIMERELDAMQADRSHRSTRATLKKLATDNVYLSLDEPRDDVLGVLPLANVGLRITDFLAQRFGHNRKKAEKTCARECAQTLGTGPDKSWSPGERLAWSRWSPLVLILPDIDRWTSRDKQALAAVIRAKGGPGEADYLARFDHHARLRHALQQLW